MPTPSRAASSSNAINFGIRSSPRPHGTRTKPGLDPHEEAAQGEWPTSREDRSELRTESRPFRTNYAKRTMPEDWKVSLARNLRALREARDFSVEALAESSGVGKATIADIENEQVGSTGPGCVTLLRLSQALGVTPDALLGMSSKPIGQALVDRESVEAIENASSLDELEDLRRPAGWRYGLQVTERFEWVSLSELAEIEQRCNARIAELYLEKKRGGKKTR